MAGFRSVRQMKAFKKQAKVLPVPGERGGAGEPALTCGCRSRSKIQTDERLPRSKSLPSVRQGKSSLGKQSPGASENNSKVAGSPRESLGPQTGRSRISAKSGEDIAKLVLQSPTKKHPDWCSSRSRPSQRSPQGPRTSSLPKKSGRFPERPDSDKDRVEKKSTRVNFAKTKLISKSQTCLPLTECQPPEPEAIRK